MILIQEIRDIENTSLQTLMNALNAQQLVSFSILLIAADVA